MGEQRVGVGIGLEQCQQVRMRPERRGIEVRLEDRLVFGIHEGDRDRAQLQQLVFQRFGMIGVMASRICSEDMKASRVGSRKAGKLTGAAGAAASAVCPKRSGGAQNDKGRPKAALSCRAEAQCLSIPSFFSG